MRLIDADALLEQMKVRLPIEDDITEGVSNCAKIARKLVAKAPTVDTVKNGRWLHMFNAKSLNNWVECSECKTVGSPFWKCCPVCEAKMGGGNADCVN